MKRFACFALLVAFLLSLAGCAPEKSDADYHEIVENHPYFVHALGGDGEYVYLNSLDVMEKRYEAGFRLFEADAALTSDNRLVMTHHWNKTNFENHLGIAYDENDPIPTYDEFMSWKLQGKYTATSFVQVLDFMRKHNDVILMLDSGLQEPEAAKKFYEVVLQEAGDDRAVLDRVMLSAFNARVLEAGLAVYDFRLRNFYISAEQSRSEGLQTIEQIIAYCKKMGCQSCSVSTKVATQQLCDALKEAGIYLFVFTTNDQEEADRLLSFGATSIGTDFLG